MPLAFWQEVSFVYRREGGVNKPSPIAPASLQHSEF